jgi:long-subunit acyl-CoA synthetase (AMP-forming)
MSMPVHHAAGIAPSAVLSDGSRRLSGGELQDRVIALAERLRTAGVTRCALLADNGCDWVIADLALRHAGLLNVPLPAHFTDAQLRHALRDAGVETILTDQPDRCAALDGDFTKHGHAEGLQILRRPTPVPVSLTGATRKITYTSGSTADPKGVCLSGTAMDTVADTLSDVIHRAGVGRHLVLLPLATLLDNLAGVHAPLRAGATCLAPPATVTGVGASQVDPQRLIAALDDQRPQSLILVPQLLRVLIGAARAGWQPPASLRFIAVGGARVPAELLHDARALGLPCYEGYGLSECASVVALNTPWANRPGSVGRPLAHARVRVDSTGHIRVGGSVMEGYAGDTAGNREDIDTGDLGYLDDDGYLYVRGRARNVFITAFGRNVSPEWPETELAASPAIAQAVVFGEARPWPVALIVPAGKGIGGPQIQQAVDSANQRLPDYAQVRRWAVAPAPFSAADGLLTANGRPRRDLIFRRHAALIDGLYFDATA